MGLNKREAERLGMFRYPEPPYERTEQDDADESAHRAGTALDSLRRDLGHAIDAVTDPGERGNVMLAWGRLAVVMGWTNNLPGNEWRR